MCDNMTMALYVILYDISSLWMSFFRIYFIFNYSFCVSLSEFVHVSAVSIGARKGHLIPWSWSYKLLRATRCGSWEWYPGPLHGTLLSAEPSLCLWWHKLGSNKDHKEVWAAGGEETIVEMKGKNGFHRETLTKIFCCLRQGFM